MKLEDVLIDESVDIRSAVEQLERVRCKVVYVIEQGKLVASISDGDIRRYVLHEGDVNLSIKHIANYNPTFLNRYEKEKIDEIFLKTEVYSVPIINYNREVIEIIFRDGRRVKRKYSLECPVVMMAGGKGTRLYPYTKILPKALIPVGEVPIAERIFNNFSDFGCRKYLMIINHKKDMIQAYFEGIKEKYVLEYVCEEKPMGTGGGLCLLKGQIQQDFFLVNCDIIIDADYNEIYHYHKKEENYITIVAAKYRHVVPYGVIKYDNKQSYMGISEKPELNYLISTGMYIVSNDLIESMPDNKEISFPDLIELYKKRGKRIGVYVVEESAYMDMGQLEELEKMKKKLNV